MDFNQLQYFMSLTKCKQFTEAAEQLHLSQSSLSKQIKALEKEIEAKLFVRTLKGCELTEEGKIFKDFAINALETKKEMAIKLADISLLQKNTISLGTMPIMSEYKISDAISSFMNNFHNYDIDIMESPSTLELVKCMKNGDINLVFIGEKLLDKNEFTEIPLIKDHLVLIVSKDNELSKHSNISLSELAYQTLILLDKSTGINEIILESFEKFYSTPKIMSGYTTSRSILSLVRDNVGITLLWTSLLNGADLTGLKVIELAENLSSHIVLGIPKNRKISIAERTFQKHIEKWFVTT